MRAALRGPELLGAGALRTRRRHLRRPSSLRSCLPRPLSNCTPAATPAEGGGRGLGPQGGLVRLTAAHFVA